MSPILVRPVREQLEHDRVIRLLQAKYKRKFDVAINPGSEQGTPITIGQSPWYPDLVLFSGERSRKIVGVVEVETAESVNKVEAMSQWVAFARSGAALHLYVPASMIDVARQLCVDLQVTVAETWAYTSLGDQPRFTLVQRTAATPEAKPRPAVTRPAAAVRRPTPARAARPARPAAARSTRRAAGATGTARRPAAKAGASRGATPPKKSPRPARAQKRK